MFALQEAQKKKKKKSPNQKTPKTVCAQVGEGGKSRGTR